jgi:hypothetical protein
VSRRDALRAKEMLAATGVPIVGVVLNRTAELPGTLTYGYYGKVRQVSQPGAGGVTGPSGIWDRAQHVWWPEVREHLVDWVGPRRGA